MEVEHVINFIQPCEMSNIAIILRNCLEGGRERMGEHNTSVVVESEMQNA